MIRSCGKKSVVTCLDRVNAKLNASCQEIALVSSTLRERFILARTTTAYWLAPRRCEIETELLATRFRQLGFR